MPRLPKPKPLKPTWLCRRPKRIHALLPPSILKPHGTSPEDLEDKPDFEGIWPEVMPYLEQTDLLLAHNARFDRNVLYATADHYGINLPRFDWVCTVDVSRATWPHLVNHKLSTVCSHLEIPLNHHDAASDAHGCANIYLRALLQSAGI